jgi:prepilin-type processing-associated H-X9-DG protein
MKTIEMKSNGNGRSSAGFVLLELGVIVVVIAFLAALLLPTLRGAREYSQVNKCLDNTGQLMLAAKMYADDNGGKWFPNQPNGGSGSGLLQSDWVSVYMDWGGNEITGEKAPYNGLEATNWELLLASEAQSPECFSLFAPYVKDPLIYKCPSDPSTVKGAPRVRSYSANAAVGTLWCYTCLGVNNSYPGGPVTGQWLSGSLSDDQQWGRCYQFESQMTRPTPSKLWIFDETHPDDINDSSDQVQISDWTLGGSFIDIMSDLHNQAASFSFADGHSESHKWKGWMGRIPFINGGPLTFPNGDSSCVTPDDLNDLNWVQARTSYPRTAQPNGFPVPEN